MLFGPEDGEQFGDPYMDGSQAVKPGVAGGTDGNQEPRLAYARPSVVNMERRIPRPTRLTSEVIASEDRLPVSAEVIPRVPVPAITLRAEASDGGDPLATGAKERLLPGTGLYPGPLDAFWTAGEG